MGEENVRKLKMSGDSYAVTIPVSIIRELGWQEKQRVVVRKRGQGFEVVDYE
jgi:antitoxin component of MazEF toxin-antitoxin module